MIVAGGMFVSVVGAVVLVTMEQNDSTQKADQAQVQTTASSLVDVLVEARGEGWFAATANRCADGAENKDAFVADGVDRLGLAAEACGYPLKLVPGNLSFDKLVNLQGAAKEADPDNGFLDYEEARLALGLDVTGQDFHIRTQPLVPTLRTLMAGGLQDPIVRPLYIGDYEPTSGLIGSGLLFEVGIGDPEEDGEESDGEEGEDEDSGDYLTLWAKITNNGLVPTIFEANFKLSLADDDVVLSRQSDTMAAGETTTMTVRVPKSADWAWKTPVIDYVLSDLARTLATGTLDASDVTMTSSETNRIFDVEPDRLQFETTGSLQKIHYDAYDGRGNQVAHTDWKLEVYREPLGLLVALDSVLHTRGWESFDLSIPSDYSVSLKAGTGEELARDSFVLLDVQLGGWGVGEIEWAPQTSTLTESEYVEVIVDQFTAAVFSADYDHELLPYAAGGDVYPDVKDELNDQLPVQLIDDKGTASPVDDEPTLEKYNVLVVGSNVDHEAMTSAQVKDTIRDWVYEGGTLIVLGSTQQHVQWLQPIFHASLQSASGGLTIPDQSHPVLDAPNRLDVVAFDTHSLGWEFATEDDASHFTHVILSEDTSVLALSDHGAFGDGRVVLTAFQPFDLLSGSEGEACDVSALTPDCDGLLLLDNLLSQAYAGLYIDYGPMLPTDRPVGAATRLVSVWHTQLEQAVALRIQVYVF